MDKKHASYFRGLSESNSEELLCLKQLKEAYEAITNAAVNGRQTCTCCMYGPKALGEAGRVMDKLIEKGFKAMVVQDTNRNDRTVKILIDWSE